MWCTTCNERFPGECVCPNRDARLARLRSSPNLAWRICQSCGKHSDLCECADGPTTRLVVARPAGPTPSA